MNLEKENFDEKIVYIAALTRLPKYKSTQNRVNSKQFKKPDVNVISFDLQNLLCKNSRCC